MVLINEYGFNKKNLGITVRLLKKNYQEGWESVGFAVTYNNTIQLKDETFITGGFFRFGFNEYTKLVKQINSEDITKITDVLYTIIVNDTGLNFRKWFIRELKKLAKSNDLKLGKAVVNDKEVETIDQAIRNYQPDKDLELHYRGRVKRYIINNGWEDRYDIDGYEESKLVTLVRFRGNSVVFQGWINGTIKLEERFHVNSNGLYSGSLDVAYDALIYKDREEALKRLKKQ